MRITTSIKINSETWKKAKHHCIDHEIELSQYVETLIKKDQEKC